MLDTIEVGLRDSQLLNAAGREVGMLSSGTEGRCRGTEAALDCFGNGELEVATLLVMRRSSTL